MRLSTFLLASILAAHVDAFVVEVDYAKIRPSQSPCRHSLPGQCHKRLPARRYRYLEGALKSNADDSLDQMRRMLEAAWDAPTMGVVPSSPNAAAEAAASSLLSALDQQEEQVSGGIYFIHLLLPQYDVSSGPQIYDEVVATEFCIALAEQMAERQIQIVLRDDRVLSNVQRVLQARERYFEGRGDKDSSAEDVPKSGSVSNSLDAVDEDDEDDDDDDLLAGDANSVQDFRAKLMSNWETSATTADPEETMEVSESVPPEPPSDKPTKNYRLASLFGNSTSFPSGSNMMNQVMQAVSVNARARADEDTVIFLNPASSPEEVIGIRALAAKYRKSGKTMILVNCQLDPLPKELVDGVTTYSIQPMVGKLIGSAQDSTSPVEPRVVILRRYPRDWEMYVDDGATPEEAGFVLAATISPSALPNPIAGPTIQWVVRQLEDYLQTKSSSQ